MFVEPNDREPPMPQFINAYQPEASTPKPWPEWAGWLLVGVAFGGPAVFQTYLIIYLLWTWISEGTPKMPDI